MVFKRRRHVVPENAGCCPKMLHPFKRAFTELMIQVAGNSLRQHKIFFASCNRKPGLLKDLHIADAENI